MEHSDFIVLLESILPNGLERRLEVCDAVSDGLELAMPLSSALTAELALTRHGSRVLVRGRVRGGLALECSRCLKGFSFPLDVNLETSFETEGEGASDTDDERSPDEMDIQHIEKGCIDLRDFLAEQIHLAVPVKTLCSEECRGLCSRCGADLSNGDCSCEEQQTDARWDALKQLKER